MKNAMRRHFAEGVLVAMTTALAGCVAYEAEDVTLQKSAAALPRHVGALTFDQAIALAMAHNGEIQAREAECRAAGLDVMPTELQAQLQQESLALMIDPFALLGLTQRGASSFLAENRAVEAAAALGRPDAAGLRVLETLPVANENLSTRTEKVVPRSTGGGPWNESCSPRDVESFSCGLARPMPPWPLGPPG